MVATPAVLDPPHRRSRRITVVGCGHVGLVVAAGFASLGHRVIGIDKSQSLVDSLSASDVPIHEAGLPELLASGLASGRLSFTTSYAEAIAHAEFVFLAVDTPGMTGGAADLRNIRSVAHSIAAHVNGSNPIIVNKSTSPIGTGDTIETILRANLDGTRSAPRIVSNPEFLRQGTAVRDFFEPDRVVVGAQDRNDALEVAGLYDGLGGALLITSLRTAEMIKYVANSFLATRISFINEIARLCEALGVSVDEVVDGVGHDPRIGRDFFVPGVGYGGSCLPKDVAALRYIGDSLGVSTPLLTSVQQVNQFQKVSAVRKLRGALGTLDGKRIAVWGLTFKGGTEDLRESPALDAVGLLLNEGADVRTYDPTQPDRLPERIQHTLMADPLEAVRGADALAILTDWPEFRRISLSSVRAAMHGDVLFDGRNVLDQDEAEAHGFRYVGVGRGRVKRAGVAAVA